jgi:hypothetical protein
MLEIVLLAMTEATVFDALLASLSDRREQRDGAQGFLNQLEQTDPRYRQILAAELADESKPVSVMLFLDVFEFPITHPCPDSRSAACRHLSQKHPVFKEHNRFQAAN